jgi:hypothetical protein
MPAFFLDGLKEMMKKSNKTADLSAEISNQEILNTGGAAC